jgi:hypothetical protein
MTTPPPDGPARDGGDTQSGPPTGPRTGEPLPDRPLPPPPPPPPPPAPGGTGGYPAAPPPSPGHPGHPGAPGGPGGPVGPPPGYPGSAPAGPYPGYKPFDPWAALALAFGIILGPLGLVFSVVSLVRTSGGKRRGRPLAIIGLVLSVLWIAGVTAIVWYAVSSSASRDDAGVIVERGRVSVEDVRTGDCIADFDEGTTFSVTGVPCAEEHTTVVYAVWDIAGDDFPGLSTVVADAEKGCVDRLPSGLEGQVDQGELSVAYFHPQEGTWSRGDREVACLVVSESGPLTQPVPTSS